MAVVALMTASSIPMVPTVAEAQPRSDSTRVRAGRIEGIGGGRYRVNLDEDNVDNAYRAATRAARARGRSGPTPREFRASVDRKIRQAVRSRYPRGFPSGSSAVIIIIVAGDDIIIIIT